MFWVSNVLHRVLLVKCLSERDVTVFASSTSPSNSPSKRSTLGHADASTLNMRGESCEYGLYDGDLEGQEGSGWVSLNLCIPHLSIYQFKNTRIPCACNCARVLVCPECFVPWRLAWSLIFYTPSFHTLDKGRLGLIFSSASSSFLFLENKDKSSKEEVDSTVLNMKMISSRSSYCLFRKWRLI